MHIEYWAGASMLTLLACAAGLYVGLHFNILALLPLSLFGAGALIVSSWSAGRPVLESIGVVVIPLLAVQVGYFLGLTAREPYANLVARLKVGLSKQA